MRHSCTPQLRACLCRIPACVNVQCTAACWQLGGMAKDDHTFQCTWTTPPHLACTPASERKSTGTEYIGIDTPYFRMQLHIPLLIEYNTMRLRPKTHFLKTLQWFCFAAIFRFLILLTQLYSLRRGLLTRFRCRRRQYTLLIHNCYSEVRYANKWRYVRLQYCAVASLVIGPKAFIPPNPTMM